MLWSHIVAATEREHVIGKDGKMPWHLSEDLRYFKAITSGKPVLMGRKTYESIGKPLPNRLNLVLSRNPGENQENLRWVSSLDEVPLIVKEHPKDWGDELMVIGGGEIYRMTLPLVKKIYFTSIQATIAGDTIYPDIPDDFNLVENKPGADQPVPFRFQTYCRK